MWRALTCLLQLGLGFRVDLPCVASQYATQISNPKVCSSFCDIKSAWFTVLYCKTSQTLGIASQVQVFSSFCYTQKKDINQTLPGLLKKSCDFPKFNCIIFVHWRILYLSEYLCIKTEVPVIRNKDNTTWGYSPKF